MTDTETAAMRLLEFGEAARWRAADISAVRPDLPPLAERRERFYQRCVARLDSDERSALVRLIDKMRGAFRAP